MIFGVLVGLGTLKSALNGAEFAGNMIERATGIPIATGCRAAIHVGFDQTRELVVAGGELLIGDAGDSLAGFLDPLHFFTDDPAAQRDAANKQVAKDKRVKKQLRAQAQQQTDQLAQQQDTLSQTQAALNDANARAAAAEAAAQQATSENDRLKKAQKAKAARGFMGVSRALANQSQSAAKSGNQDQALALAQQALAMAMAAQKPPVDARDALRSNDDDYTKQLKTDVINAVNRDGANADFDALAARLSGSDPGSARDELYDRAEAGINGADHHHGGGSCKCGGSCSSCSLDWGSSSSSSTKALPEIAGTDKLDWSSSSPKALPASSEIVDEDLIARQLRTYHSPSCSTGSCAVPRRF